MICGATRLLIKHVVEAQAYAGSGDDPVGALLAGENLADVCGAQTSAADGVECAGETADHFIQEASAFGGEGEELAVLSDVEAAHCFDWVWVVVFSVTGTIGSKVVLADQALSGLIHRL